MSLAMRRGPLGTDPAGSAAPARPGPALYLERTDRHVRGLLSRVTVVDSTRAALLHEPGVPARYLFPRDDVRTDLLDNPADRPAEPTAPASLKGPARCWDLHAGDRLVPGAVWGFPEPAPAAAFLAGHLAVAWDALDAWYEEAEQVFLEPRDPYHRVDCLHSSRRVRVRAGEVVLADSRRSVAAFETGAATRFYLPPDDVRTDLLMPSATLTRCQYKGLASYWSVRLPGGALLEDRVWSYLAPNPEALPLAGRLCFHHRGLVVTVDGQER